MAATKHTEVFSLKKVIEYKTISICDFSRPSLQKHHQNDRISNNCKL